MPAIAADPFPGYARCSKISPLGGERRMEVNIATGDTENASPGDSFTLEYSYTSFASADQDGPPTAVVVKCYLPGTAVQVGTSWSVPNPTQASGQTRTIHLDDNPLNQSAGSPRAGMIEIVIEAERTSALTWDIDSRGNGADGNDEWCRGFIRALPTISSHSISNVALAGAEPTLFAHADPMFVRITADAQFYSSDTRMLYVRQGGVTKEAEGEFATNDADIDFNLNESSEKIDSSYAVGKLDIRLELDADVISGNNGTFDEYKWATTGHEAGWTRLTDQLIEYVDRLDVDPTVSIVNFTHDQGVPNVFNRNELMSGTFQVHNARNETFTPIGSDQITFIRTSNGDSQSAINFTLSRPADTLIWSLRPDTGAGCVAPADVIGDEKALRWTDSGAVVTPSADTPAIGHVSSLLDIVDVETTYANVTSTIYNRNETATVTGRILNRRGQGFADWVNEGFDSRDDGTQALEEAAVIVSHDGGTGAFEVDITFGASGNVAPADVVGAAKLLVWDDDSLNEIDTEYQYALLSSLLDMVNVRTQHAGVNSTVYNRGEAYTVEGSLLNRRGDAFADWVTEQFRSIDNGTAADEGGFTITSHSAVTGAFVLDRTFGTAGNVAPADDVGAQKDLRWQDSSGNTTPDDQYGFLSSAYVVASHLQNNDNLLQPNLDTNQRLTSDLGFYSILVTNQRGLGVNGISITDHLQDDQVLTNQIDRTDTTQAVNGNDGYLPLKAWDSSLPGGGWDHWIDGGTSNGNSYDQPRLGASQSDFILLSKNPNIVVVPGAGPGSPTTADEHWQPGKDLLVGMALYDVQLNTGIAVDDDGGGNPRAYVIVARFNVALGRAEYLGSDEVTWSPLNGQNAYQHQLAESPGDNQAYIKTIVAANTATWNYSDLFIVGLGYVNSTPYGLQNMIPVTADVGKPEFDAVGLALSGVMSQR